jgi:surfeit locus 1 family protein
MLAQPSKPFSRADEDYQRVIVSGRLLDEYQILLRNRAYEDAAGFHLVTPLLIDEGTAILIDRGWIPYEQGEAFLLEDSELNPLVEVQGILLPGQQQPNWAFLADPIPESGDPPLRRWRIVDIKGLQAQIPIPLHDQYIGLTQLQARQDSIPIPDVDIDLSNGPHLSYSIQWFSFTGIAWIGGAILLNRERKKTKKALL